MMKLAIAQIRCVPGEVAANCRTIVQAVRAASSSGCDLVVLPEMSDTGYHMPTIVSTASSWSHGPYAEAAGAAAENKIAVVVGLSERINADIYNTVAVIGQDGALIAKYRKTHLITAEPICEQHHLRPGDCLTLCQLAGFNIGLMTCYDIRFPEVARKLTLSGAEILLVPAAFPLLRIRHWETINSCRAIENQVYVGAVNRVGNDAGLVFGGSSRLIDPYGVLQTSASETDEQMLIGEITKDRLAEVRMRMKVFDDRRPELY